MDLWTTSDLFGFPASLSAESKRQWKKLMRMRPEHGGNNHAGRGMEDSLKGE